MSERAEQIKRRKQPNAYRLSECGTLVYLKLDTDDETVIDAASLDKVLQHRWYLRKFEHSRKYAASSQGGQTLLLHRYLLDAPKGSMVDHINRVTLDNRLANLRFCNQFQNAANVPARDGTSRYKGVHYAERQKSWCASIQYENKKVYLGYFTSEEDAALMHNIAAAVFHGDFANLNPVKKGDAIVEAVKALRDRGDEARRQLESAMQLKPLLDEARRLLRQEKELRDQALGIMDGMESKLTVARDALKEIAESTRWGEDTAIKRTITMHQDTAREALAKIGGSDA